jgi:hypothetical protein
MNLHLLNPVTIHSANPRSPRPDIPNVSITLPGNLGKTCNEMINILFGRVGREAGARRALDPQRQHQRLRAVMAVPQRQSIGVEPAANVFRPHTGNGKGHDPASLQGSYGSYHANTLETGQRVEKPAGEPRSCSATASQSRRSIQRIAAPSPTAAPIGGVPASNRRGGSANSAASGDTLRIIWPEGRHILQDFAAAPKDANPGGTEGLVAGERIEIDAEALNVERSVRRSLRPIKHHGGADGARGSDDWSGIRQRARYIRAMGHSGISK